MFLALLTGCAETSIRDANGHVRFKTQANASMVYYKDSTTTLKILDLDHSTPTVADGNAFATGTQAVTSGATGMIVAGGALKAATAGQAVVRSAAPAAIAVIPQKAAQVPTATPAPVVKDAATIWPDRTSP